LDFLLFFQKFDKNLGKKICYGKIQVVEAKILFFNLTKIPQWKLKPLPPCLLACLPVWAQI
jgi:hypothetical protein